MNLFKYIKVLLILKHWMERDVVMKCGGHSCVDNKIMGPSKWLLCTIMHPLHTKQGPCPKLQLKDSEKVWEECGPTNIYRPQST